MYGNFTLIPSAWNTCNGQGQSLVLVFLIHSMVLFKSYNRMDFARYTELKTNTDYEMDHEYYTNKIIIINSINYIFINLDPATLK